MHQPKLQAAPALRQESSARPFGGGANDSGGYLQEILVLPVPGLPGQSHGQCWQPVVQLSGSRSAFHEHGCLSHVELRPRHKPDAQCPAAEH